MNIFRTLEESGVWQFYSDGEWHVGSNQNNHRKNIEEGGYTTRDLYVIRELEAEVKYTCV